MHFTDLIAPESWDEIGPEVSAIFRDRVPVQELVSTVIRKDGRKVILETNGVPVMDETGQMIGFRGTNKDITEQRGAFDAIAETNKRLNLLSSITLNDVQNQIMIIKEHILWARRESGRTASVKQRLARIEQTADKIQSYLNFIRDYQKKGKSSSSWLRLDQCLRDIVSGFDLKYIKFDLDVDRWEISSEAILSRVFYYLIENTIHHGQKVTAVCVRGQEQDGSLMLRYEDNGIGVPIDQKRAIFEVEQEDGAPGSLMLAKEILAMSGITIEEKGEPGQGALFEIKVPTGAYRRYSS